MKVLIICPPYLPVPSINGGAIESLIDEYLVHNSITKKYDITVFSIQSYNIDKKLLLKYENTEFKYFYTNKIIDKVLSKSFAFIRKVFKTNKIPSLYMLKIIRYLKSNNEMDKYDLIIIENQIESLYYFRKKIKTRLVEHLHNDYLNISVPQSEIIIKSCDEFWCVSKFIVDQLKKIDNKVNAKVLYNGIDYDKFNIDISEKEKNRINKIINYDKNNFYIIYVGRVIPEKGVLELIKAFNNIKNKDDNIKLLIVGGMNDRKNNKFYKKLYNEKKVNDDCIYFFGYANKLQLKYLYSISNLQIVPTLCEEAFGLIVVEGIYFNIPLIVTNSGGIKEIVGDNAVVINKNNIIDELEQAINLFRKKEVNLYNLKKEYNNILIKFSIENYYNNFDLFIKNNINKK